MCSPRELVNDRHGRKMTLNYRTGEPIRIRIRMMRRRRLTDNLVDILGAFFVIVPS